MGDVGIYGLISKGIKGMINRCVRLTKRVLMKLGDKDEEEEMLELSFFGVDNKFNGEKPVKIKEQDEVRFA